jgi:anthranilate synthase/aminodeoxychorismate synthase-like glutamine amidotransferase
VLDEPVDAAAARAAAQIGAQLGQVLVVTVRHHFNIAVLGIAHPAAQLQLAGLAVHKPAETYPLHATLYQKMKNHELLTKASLADCRTSRNRLLGPGFKLCAIAGTSSTLVSMVFVLDNYDSFTYNLVQYLGELGAEVEVYRNDELTVEQVEALQPERILLSPGPCTPGQAGILVPLIRHIVASGRRTPILGVCLGHQAIGEAFGANVVRAEHLMHGKTSAVDHDGKGIFSTLPTPLTCTRYHSLIVEEGSLPAELTITARTKESGGKTGSESVIMGLRHRTLPIEGVQFHPESVLTEGGHQMIRNFLNM